jgi:hypothetical protein
MAIVRVWLEAASSKHERGWSALPWGNWTRNYHAQQQDQVDGMRDGNEPWAHADAGEEPEAGKDMLIWQRPHICEVVTAGPY